MTSVALLAVALSGCGQGFSAGSYLPVKGAVTVNQVAVPYAMIEFVPLDKDATPRSVVQENGRFELPQQEGLRPGEYYAVISEYSPEDLSHLNEEQKKQVLKSRSVIPEIYQQRGELVVTIKPDVENELKLDLKPRRR